MSSDPRRTGLGCAVEWAQLHGGEYAARLGRSVCAMANALVPGAALVVVTTAMDPQLTYNLLPNTRVMMSQYCFAVETVNDDCQFEMGFTDAPDGAGTFYPIGPQKHVYTGAANQGITAYDQNIGPAYPISWAAGARCITFRVDANDAGCEISLGLHGWWEYE